MSLIETADIWNIAWSYIRNGKKKTKAFLVCLNLTFAMAVPKNFNEKSSKWFSGVYVWLKRVFLKTPWISP